MEQDPNSTLTKQRKPSFKQDTQPSVLTKSDLHEIKILKSIWLPWLPKRHPVKILRRVFTEVKGHLATCVGHMHVIKKNSMLTESHAERKQRRKELVLECRRRSRGQTFQHSNNTPISQSKKQGISQKVPVKCNENKNLVLKDSSSSDKSFKKDFHEMHPSQQAPKAHLHPCKERPFLLWRIPKGQLGLRNMKRTDFADVAPKHDKRQLTVPEWFINLCVRSLRLELRSSYPDDIAVDCKEMIDLLSTPRMLRIEKPSLDHKAWDDSQSDMSRCFIVVEGLSAGHEAQPGSLKDGGITCPTPKLQTNDSAAVDRNKGTNQSHQKETESSFQGITFTSPAASKRRQSKFNESASDPRKASEVMHRCRDKPCESMQLRLRNTHDECALEPIIKTGGCANHADKYSHLPRVLSRLGGKLQHFSRMTKASNVGLMEDDDTGRVIKPDRGSHELKFTRRRGRLTNVNMTPKLLKAGHRFRSSGYTRQSKNSNNSALAQDSIYMEYADNQVIVTSNALGRNSANQHRAFDRGRKLRKPARTKLKSRQRRRQTVNLLNPNTKTMAIVTHATTEKKQKNMPYSIEPAAFRELRAKLHAFVRQEWRRTNLCVLNTKNLNVCTHPDEAAYQNLYEGRRVSCSRNQDVCLNAWPYNWIQNEGLNVNSHPAKSLKDDINKDEVLLEECRNATWNDILVQSKDKVRNENQLLLSIPSENLHYDSKTNSNSLECTPSKHLCQQWDDKCTTLSCFLNETSYKSFGCGSSSDWFQNPLFYKNGEWANQISSENSNSFCNDSLKDVDSIWASRFGFETNVNSSSKPTKVTPKKPTTTTRITAAKQVKQERKVNKGKLPLTGPGKRLHSLGQQKVQIKAETLSPNCTLKSSCNSSTKNKQMVDSDQSSSSLNFNCKGSNLRPIGCQSAINGDGHSINDCLNRNTKVTIAEDVGEKHLQLIASQCRGGLELASRRQQSSLSMNRLPTTDLKASYGSAEGHRQEIGLRPNSMRPIFSSKYIDVPKYRSLSQDREPYSSEIFPPQIIPTDRNACPIRRSSTEGQQLFLYNGIRDRQGDPLSYDNQNGPKRDGQWQVLSPSKTIYQNHSRKAERNPQGYLRVSQNRHDSSMPADGLLPHDSNISCVKGQDARYIPVAGLDPPLLSLNCDSSMDHGTRPRESNFLQTVSQNNAPCLTGGSNSNAGRARNETGNTVDDYQRARTTTPCRFPKMSTTPPCRFPKSITNRYKCCHSTQDGQTSSETERLPSPERIMQFQLQLLSCIHQILATGLAQSTGNSSCHGNRDLRWPLQGNAPLTKPKFAWMADNEIVDLITSRAPTDGPYNSVLRTDCNSQSCNSLKDTENCHHCNGRADLQFSSSSNSHKSGFLQQRSQNLNTRVNTATQKDFRTECCNDSLLSNQKHFRLHSPDNHTSKTSCRSRKSNVEIGIQTRPLNYFQEESICGLSPDWSKARLHENSEISDLSWGRKYLNGKDQSDIGTRRWLQNDPPSYRHSPCTSIKRNYLSSLKGNLFHLRQSHQREETVKVNKKCQVGGSRIKPTNRSQFHPVDEYGLHDTQSKNGKPCPPMKDNGIRCSYKSDRYQAVKSITPRPNQSGSTKREIRTPCRSNRSSKCRYYHDNYFQNNDILDSHDTTTSDFLKTGSEKEDIGHSKYCDELTDRALKPERKNCPKDLKVATDKFDFQEDVKRSPRSPIIHIRYRSRRNPTDKESSPTDATGSFNRQQITLETELGKTLAKVIKRSLQLQKDILRLEENQPNRKCPESETNSKPTSSYDLDSLLEMPAIISYDNTNGNAKCSEPVPPCRHGNGFKRNIGSEGKSFAGNRNQGHAFASSDNSKDLNRRDTNDENVTQRFQRHHDDTYYVTDNVPLPCSPPCRKQINTHHHFNSKIVHAHQKTGHPSPPRNLADLEKPTSHLNDKGQPEMETSFIKYSAIQRQTLDMCAKNIEKTLNMQNPQLSDGNAPWRQKAPKEVTKQAKLRKNRESESDSRHCAVGRSEFIHQMKILTDGDSFQNHFYPETSKLFSRRGKKKTKKILSHSSEGLSESLRDSNYWHWLWDMNSVGQAQTFLSQRKHRHKTQVNNNIHLKLTSKTNETAQSMSFNSKTKMFVHVYNTEMFQTENQAPDGLYCRPPKTVHGELTAERDQRNGDMFKDTVKPGHPRKYHRKALPPAIKMDAWGEKGIDDPDHERSDKCSSRKEMEDFRGGRESDSKSSTQGIEEIPFDTEADARGDDKNQLWKFEATTDGTRLSSTAVNGRLFKSTPSDKCHPMEPNDTKLRKTMLASQSHLHPTFSRVKRRAHHQESECKSERGRLEEDESIKGIYLTSGKGCGFERYHDTNCRGQTATRRTSGFHVDNKMTDEAFNTPQSGQTNSTASIIISSFVNTQNTFSRDTETQVINTSDLMSFNSQSPDKTNKETQFPKDPSSLSKRASDEFYRRETSLQKAIIQWWNYPEDDTIVSPRLIQHGSDISRSKSDNGSGLINQTTGCEVPLKTMEVNSHSLIKRDNNQCVLQTSPVCQNLDIARSNRSLMVLADEAKCQHSSSKFGDLECELHLGEHDKCDRSGSHSPWKSNGLIDYGSSSTKIKTAQASTQGIVFDNTPLPLVSFGHVTEADTKRVVLEGAFYTASSAASLLNNERGNQNVLRFRIVILGGGSTEDGTRAIIGTYKREMETSRRHLTWRFRVRQQDVPFNADEK